jgi:Calpain family cysteine protease
MSSESPTIPSWVSTLQNASIAADITAADVNGTVTYAGFETIFTDIDAKLAFSRTSLTASELSDLKTIVANLNNGMTTSAYLTNVANAFVNGDAANAAWTGGAPTSTTLGNLAVGSSATQLSDLIGKWLLGTDLPSSQVNMNGTLFSVSYLTTSKPLFAASGPSINDINQGDLGDCYLMSSLAEVANQNSGLISSMFTSNGNNTYGVRFYVDGVAEYVTVNNLLADGGNVFNFGTDIWASLAEKAYAQFQASALVTGNSINDGNSWSTIGNGGAPEWALEEITGASEITDFEASGSSWYNVSYNSSLYITGYTVNTSSIVLSTLEADLAKGDDLVLSSNTNGMDSSGRTTLIADHAMSIYGFDSTTGEFEIRNPWGTENGQTWDTTFEVSLSALLADGDTITTDNVGKLLRSITDDLNGTGTSDVAWYNATTGAVGDWQVSGSTAQWTSIGTGSSTMTVAGIGDFTGNGTSDILWQNPSNNLIGEWLMNDGTPTWQLIDQGSTSMDIAGIGDFTGNGTSDILWLNPTNNLVGEWLMNNGQDTWQLVGQGSTTMKIVGVGDFNGDGTTDVLWENPTNNLVGAWQMNSNGLPTWDLIGPGSTTMNIVGVGDFLGNGTSDILWENRTNGTVGFWGMNHGQVASWNVVSTANTAYQVAGIGDYNGDGTSDILWRNPTTGDTGIWVMNNGQATWHDLGSLSTAFNVVKT